METLGIGDWLPDFTQTPAMKSLAAGLEAFKGPMQGALEGKLGIQQPGWQPGMPVAALTGGSNGPQIAVPPAPPGPDEHAGSGAPPGPVQNNNMSVTYQGNVSMARTKSTDSTTGLSTRASRKSDR
jgi:hypothetical protein